eukprot:TRINITY_DN7801_c0_g2_i1.p1 TRINITY_DN7801_c0_g2~~TRINITY_DN7801_c0_g2_i1.p1  ORF type:complete len:1171 (-),score=228.98 TRINITY_DN7801_c0_g2_i1:404-3916(-)
MVADAKAATPAKDLQRLPPVALVGMVCDAVTSGHVGELKSLVAGKADVNAGTPYDLRTPLHMAAGSGNLEMVKILVEEFGATLQQDRFGLLPIHDAAQNGHIEVRRYLQGKKLPHNDKNSVGRRNRTVSLEAAVLTQDKSQEDMMNKVFELVVKEGVFSYSTVHSEVQYFFKDLQLHPMYFQHFTPLQIATHVHCLIAAKRVARTTDDLGRMRFELLSEESGFFLTTISGPQATEAQLATEVEVANYLEKSFGQRSNVSIAFIASDGGVCKSGKERLGLYVTELGCYEDSRVVEGESSLEVLASAKFLKEKSSIAKEQYQIVMEDVVSRRRGVCRIVPGSAYPGPHPGGFVILFGIDEAHGKLFFPEVCQALRFVGLSPRRFYLETFKNGVAIYSLFFPSAREEEIHNLESTLMYATHLKSTPGKSELIYRSVMEGRVTQQVGLYLLSAVKFVYTFFPKEQYAREYVDVHKVLENDGGSQRKLETLYKICMKDLLGVHRIYELVHRHLDLASKFFEDFRRIALGEVKPQFNADLAALIEASCADPQGRQILRMFLIFNQSIRLTNFFKTEIPSAFSFRLDPAVVLKDRMTSLYPEMPYGIYMVVGRDFLGFHCRFRDVARGGIRLVLSRDRASYYRNFATIFDECYNLSHTQQNKNKDIPEGGAKGVILPDLPSAGARGKVSAQSPAGQRSCFMRYLSALLDCMLPEQGSLFTGHLQNKPEILFFGPDENTAGFMDLGAELAKSRGYPYWKALTTGKSVKLGGVPHDTYGMTTASVHTYVVELLRELGEDESNITKFQTGGPDGDLGSNEILVSKDKTVGIVDGSGVLYDPAGINRQELLRLAQRRSPVKAFARAFLGEGGFLYTVDEKDIRLPDGTFWRTGAELRDAFHLTSYASADLFVPCGGRPNAVTTDNVQRLFSSDGKPKFRLIVEGANLFFSDGARAVLENAGVHLFKDASTNKGGVTSSSLEVFAALALPSDDHTALMTYNPDRASEPPEFYAEYVKQILDTIVDNARQEFKAIWKCNQMAGGTSKVEATKRLSLKINQMSDSIQANFVASMSEQEKDQLTRRVLAQAVPPLMVERLGIDGILSSVPQNYIGAIVGCWLASRFVYQHGIEASEVSFFFFLRNILASESPAAPTASPLTNGKRPATELNGSHANGDARRARVA